MRIRFLIDENLPPRLKLAVQRTHPDIDILRVGDRDAPPLETLDPEILQYLEDHQRTLITANRKSMPDHAKAHWENGGELWGLFWVREDTSLADLVEYLVIMWEIYEVEELENWLDWIP